MSKNNNVKNTNLRLNLKRDEDRQAWEYLQNRDKTEYSSYSKTIVIALNDYFRRQQKLAEDPFLETREREDAFCRKLSDYLVHDLEPILSSISIRTAPSETRQRMKPEENRVDLEERNRELADNVLSIFG